MIDLSESTIDDEVYDVGGPESSFYDENKQWFRAESFWRRIEEEVLSDSESFSRYFNIPDATGRIRVRASQALSPVLRLEDRGDRFGLEHAVFILADYIELASRLRLLSDDCRRFDNWF